LHFYSLSAFTTIQPLLSIATMPANHRLIRSHAVFTILCCLLGFLSTVDGQSTVAAPIISTITGCPMSANNSTMICSQPFTLTIAGSNLNAPSSLVNLSNTFCTPYAQSSSVTTCTVPNAYTPVSVGYNSPVPVSIFDMSTQLTSNTVVAFQLLSVPPITLSSISGCTGSGAFTTGCNLTSSVVTITGSGFQLDNQPWYLLVSANGVLWTDRSVPLIPTGYTISGNSIILPLNYLLARNAFQNSNGFGGPPAAGNMSVCFTHGNTLSNCLTLSFFTNSSAPISTPTVGFVITSAITVSGISGCSVDNPNGTTSGCVSAATLTITGSGFSYAGFLVAIGEERCISISASFSTMTCYLPDEVTAIQYGVWLPVTVVDTVNQLQSLPFMGIQFNQAPVVSLSSISGCAGDGLSSSALVTSLCDPINGVITFTGTGFVVDSTYRPWQIASYVPGSSTSITQSYSVPTSYIINSTSFQIPASYVFAQLLPLATGPNLTAIICLEHGYQLATSCAWASVIVPRPTFTGVSGCQTPMLNASVIGCNPGVSVLTIIGTYFLSATVVTVAGQACPLVSSTQTRLTCTVPIVFGVQPNTPYDLVVSNFAATLTLSGAVSFTAHPTINSLTSQFCPPDFTPRSGPLALYCAPYAILTIVGSFFSDLSTLSVQITSPSVTSKGVPITSLVATNVMFDSTNVLTCVLPDPGNWFAYSSYLNVQVLENATYSSNVVAAYLYYNAQSDPHITSIQGCSQPSPGTAGVAGCQVGNLVTLVGVNFLASLSTQVQLFSQGDTFVCASARVLSSTAMTCLLPYMPGLSLDSVVPIRISNMNGRTSNWLVAVNYQSLSSTSSSETKKFVISLAVLVPIVALLLVVVAVLCWCNANGGKLSRPASWLRHTDVSGDSEMQMGSVHSSSEIGA
jgi:hypothetical protein